MDTSALMKVYVEEEGSSLARRLSTEAGVLAMSRVGYAEARAGLALALRMGRLDDPSFTTALRSFEERWAQVSVVEVSEPLVREAGDLAQNRALRGFDAIHLASAMVFQRQTGETVTFSAWDGPLLRAAEAEGLAVVASV
jgi:predicted nucleic acid-binding protein